MRASPLSFVLVCLPSVALATPNFPGVVRSTYELTYAPPCAMCHSNGVTGIGTVNTEFGKAVRARATVAGDADSLRAALKSIESEQVDSDGNGTPDSEQLQAGLNPNDASQSFVETSADGGAAAPAEPTTGCGQVAPRSASRRGSPRGFAWCFAALALALRGWGLRGLGARGRLRRKARGAARP
jgi:cytochrome c1